MTDASDDQPQRRSQALVLSPFPRVRPFRYARAPPNLTYAHLRLTRARAGKGGGIHMRSRMGMSTRKYAGENALPEGWEWDEAESEACQCCCAAVASGGCSGVFSSLDITHLASRPWEEGRDGHRPCPDGG